MGLVQAEKPPPSNWHSNVSAAGGVMSSVPVKENVAEVLLVGFAGCAVMLVSGGVVSPLHPARKVQLAPLFPEFGCCSTR